MTNQNIKINTSECDFCGVCVSICPCSAIILKEREISVIYKKCKQCCWCINLCPLGAIKNDGKTTDSSKKKSSIL